MHEKDMVLDVLSGAKASLGTYAKAITECSCQNLRQTLQQMRDSDEKFQYDLYKIAEQKGYYMAAPQANQSDASGIKSHLSQGQGQGGPQIPGLR